MKISNYNTVKNFKKQIKSKTLKFNLLKKKISKSYKKIIFNSLKIKGQLFRKKIAFIYIKHNKNFIVTLKILKNKYVYKLEKQKNNSNIKVIRKQLFPFKKFSLINSVSSNFNLISNLYNKFLSFIFKVGKKNIWNTKFSEIFDLLAIKLHYSKSTLLLKIFTRLFTRVEVKKVKSRKRITYIPFFIKTARSIFLALKWIFLSTVKKKGNISFKNKLFNELLQILTQKSCFSIQKVEENNISAFKNRSNIHYRWQKTR